jgi:hypothetical protein
MLIKMNITALAVDQFANSPVVILKDEEDNHMLPIWIGPLEASAIATELEGIELSRPMTHDLLKNILNEVGAEVQKIVITDLVDNTYYARIYLKIGDKEMDIDARPSDSMALALRTKVPILVDEKVLQESRSVKINDNVDLSDEEKMKELLENLDPESFKYKM